MDDCPPLPLVARSSLVDDSSVRKYAVGSICEPAQRRKRRLRSWHTAQTAGRGQVVYTNCIEYHSLPIALCCRPGLSAYAYAYAHPNFTFKSRSRPALQGRPHASIHHDGADPRVGTCSRELVLHSSRAGGPLLPRAACGWPAPRLRRQRDTATSTDPVLFQKGANDQ